MKMAVPYRGGGLVYPLTNELLVMSFFLRMVIVGVEFLAERRLRLPEREFLLLKCSLLFVYKARDIYLMAFIRHLCLFYSYIPCTLYSFCQLLYHTNIC